MARRNDERPAEIRPPDDDAARITILGSGTSHGIPMIGCSCPVCTSDDVRDRRTRSCVLVEWPGASIVIDTPPEFRLQCVSHHVARVDAVLYTHTHADHIAGLDDLRRFCSMQSQAIPCYASRSCLDCLLRKFGYAFRPVDQDYSERPRLHAVAIDGPFHLLGKTVFPLALKHGRDDVLGFKIDRWAYCTDCSSIPPEAEDQLHDLDVLIIDALRYTAHPTHFNVEQTLEVIASLRPKRAYLTHIAHEIRHADLENRLPDGVYLSYDGLQLAL